MKIKRSPLAPAGKIQNKTSPNDTDCLRFSFRHLDNISNPKFHLCHCTQGYIDKFLSRIKDLENTTLSDFRSCTKKALRNHKIEWERTSEPDGFQCLPKHLQLQEPWQFGVTANAHGRVHGFLIDNLFYVVWIDPNHELFPE